MLDRRALLCLAAATLLVAIAAAGWALLTSEKPGTPLGQSAAIGGAILLLTPVGFSVAKRSGWSASPPTWFVAHVLCSSAGACLVIYHAAGGNLFSPPGLILLALIFLIGQGTLARVFLPDRIATLFASRVESFYYAEPVRRERIREIIRRKRVLLTRLDASADEALFSPNLWHALRYPCLTLRYARLAAMEARLVGRRKAGLVLAFWRRLHLLVACFFVVGLMAHVIVMTFFAGYAAGGGPVDWWHIAAWGG